MTYIVSGGALNSTHSLTILQPLLFNDQIKISIADICSLCWFTY